MALTNVATCLQTEGPQERDFINSIADIKVNDQPLFTILARDMIDNGNPKIKLAACELLSNLSLSRSVIEQAE